jgi:hypothetical protein
MRDGEWWPLPTPAPIIAARGFGLSQLLATPTAAANQLAPSMRKHPSCAAMFPTPTANDGRGGIGHAATAQGGLNLRTAVHRFATPTSRDHKSGRASAQTMARNARPLSEQIGAQNNGGSLNPTWVEWLMGWPIGWTDCAPSATAKYPHNLCWPGGCLPTHSE